MSDQPEALRLAEELDAYHTRSCHKEASAELRRLHKENERLNADIESWRMTLAAAIILGKKVTAENERLREALQAALDGGCSYVHENEDDEIGRHGCCDALSYKPHEPDCWTLKAKAALRREDTK